MTNRPRLAQQPRRLTLQQRWAVWSTVAVTAAGTVNAAPTAPAVASGHHGGDRVPSAPAWTLPALCTLLAGLAHEAHHTRPYPGRFAWTAWWAVTVAAGLVGCANVYAGMSEAGHSALLLVQLTACSWVSVAVTNLGPPTRGVWRNHASAGEPPDHADRCHAGRPPQ